MITYRINEPDIVGFTDLEVCMRLTVGALGMDLTLLVEWVQGRATGELKDNPFNYHLITVQYFWLRHY